MVPRVHMNTVCISMVNIISACCVFSPDFNPSLILLIHLPRPKLELSFDNFVLFGVRKITTRNGGCFTVTINLSPVVIFFTLREATSHLLPNICIQVTFRTVSWGTRRVFPVFFRLERQMASWKICSSIPLFYDCYLRSGFLR